jgi:deoxyguanosine kinase
MHSTERSVVVLEGGIGAGKTTTAALLAERLQVPVILEDTDRHPFLPAFYEQPDRYALETELGFVLLHAHQLKKMHTRFCVADFSIAKDLVFAKLSLGSEELQVFQAVYDWATRSLGKPQLVVFLEVGVEAMLARIRVRGRHYESGISEPYLTRLLDEYILHMADLGDKVVRLPVAPEDTPAQVADAVLRIVKDWALATGQRIPIRGS